MGVILKFFSFYFLVRRIGRFERGWEEVGNREIRVGFLFLGFFVFKFYYRVNEIDVNL